MHILSHLRERSLQRYRMTPLVFQGEARVDIEEILIADMKQSQMETSIQAPFITEIDFILRIRRPFMRHMSIGTIHTDGIHLSTTSTSHIVKLHHCLWTEEMHRVVMTETDMMTWIRTIIECRAISGIIDSRSIAMLQMTPHPFFLGLWIDFPVIIQGIEFGTVMGIYSREVSKELRREQIIPVQSCIEVSPIELRLR